MPNFIAKFSQTLSETFKGPRTLDEEFTKKAQKFERTEEALINLSNVISSYKNLNKGIKNVNNDLKKYVKILYENTHFNLLYEYIFVIRENMDKCFDEFMSNLNNQVIIIKRLRMNLFILKN